MPDQKDRFSDPELDRSNKAFEEIVAQPDMQALNDQGDAISRDLDGSERNPGLPNGLDDNSGAAATKRAENDNAHAPDNRFNYQQPTKQQQSGKSSGWSNKRKLLAGGGIGGAIIGIVVSMVLLLPMKVPGLLSLATDKAGQRLEQITEKRAKLILGRAILTKFGTHSGIVLTGDGAFKTLVASMRTSNFEKRLAAKGLTIEKTPDGVKLFNNKRELAGGRTLRTEQQVVDALEGDRLTNKLIKDVVKEDIPAWRLFKKYKFAKWLRIKYGIPRYGLKDSDKKTEEERAKDYDKQRVESANSRTLKNFSGLIKCTMSGSCPEVDGTSDPSIASQTDAETKPVADLTLAGEELAGEVDAGGLGSVSKKISERLIQSITKILSSKAIPVVGWIDLVATIEHMVNDMGAKDYFGKVIAFYRGAAYAGIFAEWAGYGSQIQLGAMEPSYVGQLATELDGAEQAITFQTYDNNPGTGTPIEITVDSSQPSEVSKAFKTYTDSTFGGIFHAVMNAYYETVGTGGILGWLSGKLGGGLAKVLGVLFDPIKALIGAITPDALVDLAVEQVKTIAPFLLKTFGLTIDTFERGAKLYNNIVGGAEVSTNQYCKEIGCRRLSDEQAFAQNTLIKQEQQTYRAQKGIAYSLFSSREPTSLSSQFIYKLPSSPSATVASIGNTIKNTPAMLMALLTPRTMAASTNTNLFNIAMYGGTNADLDKPLSQAFLDGAECPTNSDTTFNDCSIDTITAEAMACEFTDCSDEGSTAADNAGGEVRIATFNIFHSSDNAWQDRLMRSVNVLESNGIDVAGLQEVRPDQNKLFRNQAYGGDTYEMFPTALQNPEYSPNPIIWNKTKYKLIKTDSVPFTYFGGMNEHAPLVKLEDNQTHQQFYVINTHDPADARGEAAIYRYQNALKYAEVFKNMAKEGLPIFFTGDFNSGYSLRTGANNTYQEKRENLTYCIVTDNTGLWDAWDAFKNKTGKCPSTQVDWSDNFGSGDNPIDHIYISTNLSVSKFFREPRGLMNNGSDAHDTIIADVVMPGQGGSEGGGSVGGWSWPVDEKWWKSSRADFLDAHPTYSQTFTSPSIYGVAADIGVPPDGSPVYAMLGGKVLKTNLCGAGDGMIIESDTPEGKIQIAYGHGTNPRFSVGQSVKSGQQILNLGAVGCKVSGGHLHVDMTINQSHVCPQDVFLAMGAGKNPDLKSFISNAKSPCAR